jgi:hypothetical protein
VTLLKRIIRNCIKRFETWIEDEETIKKNSPSEYEFVYQWLNSKFLELVKQGYRRPYAWGILQGVNLAHALGIRRISILEFGVAGGNGQIEMERIAAAVEKSFNVQIDIYGFDTGAGLPGPMDYRDVPNLCSEGLYRMDPEKLRGRLEKSQLVLGDIKNTLTEFLRSRPSPIAFIACDLVLYTSTVNALRVLDADESVLLPRIHCYFDDVLGFTLGDCNGERLAIHEFNAAHPMRKISPIYGLKYYLPTRCFNEMWVEKFWIAHIFDHSMYGKRDNLVNRHNLELAVE